MLQYGKDNCEHTKEMLLVFTSRDPFQGLVTFIVGEV